MQIRVSVVFYPTALNGCRGIVFTHGVGGGGVYLPVSEKPKCVRS